MHHPSDRAAAAPARLPLPPVGVQRAGEVAALIVAPLSLLTIALVLGAGVTTVWLSTLVTRPLLRPAFAAA